MNDSHHTLQPWRIVLFGDFRTVALACTLAVLLGASQNTVAVKAGAVPSAAVPNRLERPLGGNRVNRPKLGASVAAPSIPSAFIWVPAGQFYIKRIVVDGASVFKPEDFAAIVDPLAGKKVSWAQLVDAANQITALYRKQGFVLAHAEAATQTNAGQLSLVGAKGIAHIRVFEGEIISIDIRGQAPAKVRAQIKALALRIVGVRPAKPTTLRRYIRLVNDTPGVTAKLQLQAVGRDKPDLWKAIVTVVWKPVAAAVRIDNHGSRFSGRNQARAAVSARSIVRGGDEASAEMFYNGIAEADRGGRDFSARYSLPVGREGMRAAIFSGASSQKNEIAPGFALHGTRIGGGIAISKPLYVGSTNRVDIDAVVDGYRDRQRSLGVTLFEDSIAAVRAGASWSHQGQWFASNLSTRVHKGLVNSGSRTTGKGNFVRTTIDGEAVAPLGDTTEFYARARGQISGSGRLPSEERFGAGGGVIGRGYDPNSIAGDSGVAASVELRWRPTWGNAVKTTVYGFTDAARVFENESASRQSLVSAGAGVRLRIGRNADITGEVAVPLKNLAGQTTNAGNPRVLFGINIRY